MAVEIVIWKIVTKSSPKNNTKKKHRINYIELQNVIQEQIAKILCWKSFLVSRVLMYLYQSTTYIK